MRSREKRSKSASDGVENVRYRPEIGELEVQESKYDKDND